MIAFSVGENQLRDFFFVCTACGIPRYCLRFFDIFVGCVFDFGMRFLCRVKIIEWIISASRQGGRAEKYVDRHILRR